MSPVAFKLQTQEIKRKIITIAPSQRPHVYLLPHSIVKIILQALSRSSQNMSVWVALNSIDHFKFLMPVYNIVIIQLSSYLWMPVFFSVSRMTVGKTQFQ